MKPKISRKAEPGKSSGYDRCQTPPYAIAPLIPYLKNLPCKYRDPIIWEPAFGEGILSGALFSAGFDVIESDILQGSDRDFIENITPWHFDAIVTNPPYSDKYRWISRCYELGQPWALLMPVETIGAASAQMYFRQYGVETMYLNKRVNFKMPDAGWTGSGAQFPVCWYSWKVTGQERIFADIFPTKEPQP